MFICEIWLCDLICIFLNSENLICLTTDISKCFRGSLQLQDNESRLYMGEQLLDFLNDLTNPHFSSTGHFQTQA